MYCSCVPPVDSRTQEISTALEHTRPTVLHRASLCYDLDLPLSWGADACRSWPRWTLVAWRYFLPFFFFWLPFFFGLQGSHDDPVIRLRDSLFH
jgi:hypothetical protein